MSSKAKVIAKATELGYTLHEDWSDIRLQAPDGYCFDQDYHEVVSEYGGMTFTTKAQAWSDIYSHIGKAELCQIEECDWCGI